MEKVAQRMGWQRVGWWLDHGEAFAVDLAVEVKGKHVIVTYRIFVWIS